MSSPSMVLGFVHFIVLFIVQTISLVVLKLLKTLQSVIISQQVHTLFLLKISFVIKSLLKQVVLKLVHLSTILKRCVVLITNLLFSISTTSTKELLPILRKRLLSSLVMTILRMNYISILPQASVSSRSSVSRSKIKKI